MPELILHHYDFSPFGEKIRLAFGLKTLGWRAVNQPLQLPKPDLVPLTGGYARIPVLQIGADVFGDTNLILREIDRRHPEPTLFPGGPGLSSALGWWWERACFMPAASLVMSAIGDTVPAEFLAERKETMRHDFSKAASQQTRHLNRQIVAGQMTWLAEILRDGRPFLLGEQPSAADLSAYHMLWFTRRNGGREVEVLLPFAPLEGWMERVAAMGHGDRSEMDPADAMAVAKAAEPDPVRIAPGPDPLTGIEPGTTVAIGNDDTAHDPVRGTLVAADAATVVLRHAHEAVGTVHIHLPRVGYDLRAA